MGHQDGILGFWFDVVALSVYWSKFYFKAFLSLELHLLTVVSACLSQVVSANMTVCCSRFTLKQLSFALG